jgi:broad specificity phosphatase PhoE
MLLVVVRHAESVENADKYNGFYQDRRPYSGQAAHQLSRTVVGLTPRGFRQAGWLGAALADLLGEDCGVYTSTYRRAIDTAAVAFPRLPDGWPKRTPLLDEQHYGDATYMTKAELFATFPEGADDRRSRKHLWVPPGGGESLAGEVSRRGKEFVTLAQADLAAGRDVIAVTHHTTILALRAILEARPVEEVVAEARESKTPVAGIFRYSWADGEFTLTGTAAPDGV